MPTEKNADFYFYGKLNLEIRVPVQNTRIEHRHRVESNGIHQPLRA